MKQFEYTWIWGCLNAWSDPDEWVERLQKMGRQGWELVSVIRDQEEYHCAYFKRELRTLTTGL